MFESFNLINSNTWAVCFIIEPKGSSTTIVCIHLFALKLVVYETLTFIHRFSHNLNYSQGPLFENLAPGTVDLISSKIRVNYQPSNKTSLDFRCATKAKYSLTESEHTEDKWIRFKLYQSGVPNGKINLLC